MLTPRTNRASRVLFAPALLLLMSSGAAAGLAIDPGTACRLLDDEGLRTREGYRETQRGLFQCASIPHRLPRGTTGRDEVRFVATGDRGRARQLQLELALQSRGDLRPVLDAFAALAAALVARGLQQPLPAEVRQAVAAGRPGTWPIGGAAVALEQIAGSVPVLRLVVR